MKPGEADPLAEDLGFDDELEGFLNGSTGTTNPTGMVNLQPQATTFGVPDLTSTPAAASPASDRGGTGGAGGGTAAKAIGVAAAAVGSAAGALMGGKFAAASDVIGGAVGNMASAAVPTSLQPVKESASRWLANAKPWKDFVLPLSVPAASDGCSRITSNIYNFQTNYAILFIAQLALGIVLQPSALVAIVMTVVVWIFFLKKNDDPDWSPTLGGMQLGPVQRWLLLAAATTLILLFVAGGTIINSSASFIMAAFAHGVFHDTSGLCVPGTSSLGGLQGDPIPL
mmetsp:Transcript_77126/g.223205  ORF Transcript_77126/g.223205 Transcript_77126/m.223205 type:complete len:284 (+) Transcript_77126:99-950(+)